MAVIRAHDHQDLLVSQVHVRHAGQSAAILSILLLLGILACACVAYAVTTPRAMHLRPYILLGPRYDYSNTDLLRFPTARPGITTDWLEDNGTRNGKRYQVSGRPVFMNVGGFTLLRQ